MQRILYFQLIGLCFVVSGCGPMGPWSLTQSDSSPGWGSSQLDYAVRSDDVAGDLEKAEELRLANERKALAGQQSSPGILPKVDPIDPDELTRQVQQRREQQRFARRDRKAQESPIQSVAHSDRQQFNTNLSPMRQESNPLQPRPSQQVVSHPLKPLHNHQRSPANHHSIANPLVAKNTSESDTEVTIQQLPPVMQGVPTNPRPTSTADPSGTILTPMNVADSQPARWNTTDSNQFQAIQQVSFDQEVQDQEVQDPEKDPEAKTETPKGTESIAEKKPESDEWTQPGGDSNDEPEAFSPDDFYAAGWCKQPECQDDCQCPEEPKVASTTVPLPKSMPTHVFSDTRSQWEFPLTNPKLKPIQDEPVRVASNVQPTPAPANESAQASELPNPTANKNANFLPNLDSKAIVMPVGAIEEIDRLVESVTNADFNLRAPEPAPKEPALTWRQHLDQTIQMIQSQVDNTIEPAQRRQLEGKLQLLRLLPDELDEQQQLYINALTDLLQTTADPSQSDLFETGKTLEQLRGAVSYLESIANMKVANANFCNKVTGFGQFQLTKSTVFKPGQQVLVYCEIQNHSSQPKVVEGQAMSSTKLAGSFIVYDQNQKVVQQSEFPVVEDLARQRRRDFYMHIPFTIGDLAPGHYTYQLMIDDVGGGKSASLEPMLQFEVR